MKRKSPTFDPDGRYHKDGTYLVQQETIQDREGEAFRQGEGWTDADHDLLLDGYLVHNWPLHDPVRAETFLRKIGRTARSIKSRLWRIGARAGDGGKRLEYTPRNRFNRAGAPWTHKDAELMKRALSGDGPKFGADNSTWIAKVLGRSPDEVGVKWALLGRSFGLCCVERTPEEIRVTVIEGLDKMIKAKS